MSAITVWLTNVLVFALSYWQLDAGGPASSQSAAAGDLMFPQQALAVTRTPEFVDYLYLSFTNATSLGPTDTLPPSRWAKLADDVASAHLPAPARARGPPAPSTCSAE